MRIGPTRAATINGLGLATAASLVALAPATPAEPRIHPEPAAVAHFGSPIHQRGLGRLTVETNGTATLITLTATGGEPVVWSATTDAPWLRLSRTGGVLRPGQSITIVVEIDTASEPSGRWSTRVAIAPGGSTVTVEGEGKGSG
ncbi:BACON domain-containing protein [Nocardia sp. CWNU-33]|uniref:BACON domain-containing protein n=1 Tax=Nocardia sp. CWNU-33 TaxID=3392117 RepID=UPI00398E6D83